MNSFQRERLRCIDQVRKWTAVYPKDKDGTVVITTEERADLVRKTMLVQGSTRMKAEEYLSLVLGE